jgi:hypothetical protein
MHWSSSVFPSLRPLVIFSSLINYGSRKVFTALKFLSRRDSRSEKHCTSDERTAGISSLFFLQKPLRLITSAFRGVCFLQLSTGAASRFQIAEPVHGDIDVPSRPQFLKYHDRVLTHNRSILCNLTQLSTVDIEYEINVLYSTLSHLNATAAYYVF